MNSDIPQSLKDLATRKGCFLGPFVGLDGGDFSLRRGPDIPKCVPMRRVTSDLAEIQALLELLPDSADWTLPDFGISKCPFHLDQARYPEVHSALIEKCLVKGYHFQFRRFAEDAEMFCVTRLPGANPKSRALYISESSAQVMYFLSDLPDVMQVWKN